MYNKLLLYFCKLWKRRCHNDSGRVANLVLNVKFRREQGMKEILCSIVSYIKIVLNCTGYEVKEVCTKYLLYKWFK